MALSELEQPSHSAAIPGSMDPHPHEVQDPNPLSVPNLIAKIHEIEDQMDWLNSIGLGPTERAISKRQLAEEKAMRVFALLGERGNPDYRITVTLFRQDEDEIHARSAHRFRVDVDDKSGSRVGSVGATIDTLSRLNRIPYFQNDSRKVLYEVVKPDVIETEKSSMFATRTHDEIRTIERDYGIAKEKKDKQLMRELSLELDKVIKEALRLRVSTPDLRRYIRVKLRQGKHKLMVNLQFVRPNDPSPSNDFATIPWTKEIELMIDAAGGYDWIDPRIDPIPAQNTNGPEALAKIAERHVV